MFVYYLVLQTGLITGVSLAVILGLSFGTLATLFTNDAQVLAVVRSGVLVCMYMIFILMNRLIRHSCYIYP